MKSQVETEKKLCVSHTANPHDKREREDYLTTYTPKVKIEFSNQRDATSQVFMKNEILVQVEGISNRCLRVRGKYPNDAYFATVKRSQLEKVTGA